MRLLRGDLIGLNLFICLCVASFSLLAFQSHAGEEGAKKVDDKTPSTEKAKSEENPETVKVEDEGSAEGEEVPDLTDLDIDDLMSITVSLVSRGKGQSLFTSPAAIHVITEEDIRRTGHQQIPEVLRLVPGMHVGRVKSSSWAISARGFNGTLNRFQLVQMDGRSLYSPSFSGVFWANQDTVMEDIKQIEVVRGPGATLWGANAVNGIISIETKHAKDTQGLLVSGLGGSEERAGATVRYGGKIGDDIYWRVYAKHVEHATFEDKVASFTDDWNRTQGGFRFDWDGEGPDKVTWQGDIYQSLVGASVAVRDFSAGVTRDVDANSRSLGHNFLTRWTHSFSDTNETVVQAYYDRTSFHQPPPDFDLTINVATYDLDFQHSIELGGIHSLSWGLNYRMVDVDLKTGGPTSLDPSGGTFHTYGFFVQDTISVIKDKLSVIIGTKLEYNPFTEFEYQPSARVLFTPNDKNTLWWAASRALRVPNITDNGVRFRSPIAPGLSATLVSNRDLDSEEVIAFEMGYRAKPVDWFSLDVTVFHNRYDNYIGNQLVNPLPPVIVRKNLDTAQSYGFEAAANWSIGDSVRMAATYSWLDVQISGDNAATEHSSPANMFHIRSYYDITDFFELNTAIYYYDTVSGQATKAYWRGDLGITWRPPVDNLEISVWGTNLFDQSHKEYGANGFLSRAHSEVERGVFGKVTWKF